MTEAEAIHFLQKCERLWLGQKNSTPGKVISKTWHSCFSVIVSGLTLAFSLAFNYFQIDKGSTWARFDVLGGVFALIVIGISMSLMIRLNRVRSVLNRAVIASR